MLAALSDMFPDNNVVPKTMYEAKKILRKMGMDYQKIHACPNDLFYTKMSMRDYKSVQNVKSRGINRGRMLMVMKMMTRQIIQKKANLRR